MSWLICTYAHGEIYSDARCLKFGQRYYQYLFFVYAGRGEALSVGLAVLLCLFLSGGWLAAICSTIYLYYIPSIIHIAL